MRTTLNLDEDALDLVKRYSEARSLSIGKAVSELVKRALTTPLPTREVNGLHVFVLPPDAPPVDTELIERLADEID